MFNRGRNDSGNKLAKHSACLASRACALGPQPGSIAGILNLPWRQAVPSVCISGLSINTDVLETELYVMFELRYWWRTGQTRPL